MKSVFIDSQILSNMQRCGARVNFYFNNDLRTFEKPLPLLRGSLIHYFFSEYYGRRLKSDNNLDWPSCANEAWPFTKANASALELPDVDVNNVFRSLEQYVELHQHEPLEVKFVEEPFAFELYKDRDIQIIYVGVIDLIASIMGSEDKVFDHKSQSRRSEYLLLDDQFEGYCVATEKNNLWVNVIGLQTSLKPEEKFRRAPLSYPPYVLDRWKQHAIYWVKQYFVYDANNEWPENHQGCNKFNLCEFYELCTSASDAARAWKMQTNYLVGEKWDPTKVLEHRE